jgi:hypothetical protein
VAFDRHADGGRSAKAGLSRLTAISAKLACHPKKPDFIANKQFQAKLIWLA